MNKTNPPAVFRPLYQQIKMLITESLMSGEWRPGEAIPSEIELAARFKVSQGTVRKAVDELAGENLLIRQQGRGTFVASYADERRKFHFWRFVPDDGGKLDPVGELLDCRQGIADRETARLLEMKTGASLLIVTRIMRLEGNPVMLDEFRLPARLFKGLSTARINQYRCKMYSLFESEYNIRILQVTEQIKAVTANSEQAHWLEIPENSPLLEIERIAYTFNDKPVEWRRSLCNTKQHSYMNKIV